MRWLVGMAMVFSLGVALQTRAPAEGTRLWLGDSDDGAMCFLAVDDDGWEAGCTHGRCRIPTDVRGHSMLLLPGGFVWSDAFVHIDTRSDHSSFPRRDGGMWQGIRWGDSGPAAPAGLPWAWRWAAVATLLATTLVAAWWRRRPRAPRLDLTQLRVEDGRVLPDRPPRGALPRADWPAGVPLPGAHGWVAGRREGGRGGGLRELEPRFEIVHVASAPIRALDLAPPLPPAGPLLSRSERCLWLVALLAPVAAGSVAIGLIVAASAMAFVVALSHDLVERLP